MIYRLCYCTYLFVLTALWLNMNNLMLVTSHVFWEFAFHRSQKNQSEPQSVGSSFIRKAYFWFCFYCFWRQSLYSTFRSLVKKNKNKKWNEERYSDTLSPSNDDCWQLHKRATIESDPFPPHLLKHVCGNWKYRKPKQVIKSLSGFQKQNLWVKFTKPEWPLHN